MRNICITPQKTLGTSDILAWQKEMPPRSCHFTPCDFFVGFIKLKVYANKSHMILQLQAAIKSVIGDIGPQKCGKVISNFEEHLNECRFSAGGHTADVVFCK